MRCPFLEESSVLSCRVAPFRKLIPGSLIHEDDQRCSSAAYVNCPAAQGHLGERRDEPHCPFLEVALVQYCKAAPVAKFIPYNDDLHSRCNSESHRYCQLYLELARPRGWVKQRNSGDGGGRDACGEQRSRPAESIPRESVRPVSPSPGTGPAEEIAVPPGLSYSRNHMWVDVAEDGSCHVGMDAFLARVLGRVEREIFVSQRGLQRPTVVLTVGDVDLSLTFPNRVNIMSFNTLLRSTPDVMAQDPYGSGWFFEGTDPGYGDGSSLCGPGSGLLSGGEATTWMRQETDRMSGFVHELLSRRCHQGEMLMADGGVFSSNLAQYLDREELLQLFNLFFAPHID